MPCRYCLRRELLEEILLPKRNKRQLSAQPHADGKLSDLYLWIYRKARPGGTTRRSASHPVRQRFLRVPEYRWLLRVPHTFVLREPYSSSRIRRISADTLWMRSRKESSWIITNRQYRECITATAWQDWKAAFPVSAERIMKKGNKCVARKKNRFSRPFGRGLTARSQSATTRLDKALTYVKNRRETSMTYLEDRRCSFTNNLSENAIRPFTVGRKNWLFSDSVEGAEASAIAYTMVEMAKAHNLNIYQYLSYVLEQRPNENWSDEQLAELALWSEKLQTLKM